MRDGSGVMSRGVAELIVRQKPWYLPKPPLALWNDGVSMAHDARVQFKADGRHVASRTGRACGTVSFRTPRGTRRLQIKATVRDARELRGAIHGPGGDDLPARRRQVVRRHLRMEQPG